jgi:hypothetical protein
MNSGRRITLNDLNLKWIPAVDSESLNDRLFCAESGCIMLRRIGLLFAIPLLGLGKEFAHKCWPSFDPLLQSIGLN